MATTTAFLSPRTPVASIAWRGSILSPSTSLSVVTKEKGAIEEAEDDIDAVTRKWGLEGGLLKSAQQGNFDQAKDLLKKYGAAYLATSISFAIVSFAICYSLVDSGVDVTSLLAKVGIVVDTGSSAETAGTATIAYIVHKAASPIRTVPVVALTPVVAQWLGKEVVEEEASESE